MIVALAPPIPPTTPPVIRICRGVVVPGIAWGVAWGVVIGAGFVVIRWAGVIIRRACRRFIIRGGRVVVVAVGRRGIGVAVRRIRVGWVTIVPSPPTPPLGLCGRH